MNSGKSTIELEIRASVAYLTLARPDVSNTIDLQLARELLKSIVEIEAAGARAVILTGAGRNFCFGGDLRGMAVAGANMAAYLRELTTVLHGAITLMAELPMPVIAAVNGTAAGAGLGLVLAADLAVAGRSAKFAPAYTAVGLSPDAGCTFFLPRAVGHKRAVELFLSNRVLDAEQAFDWGLVNDIVDDDKLAEAARVLGERLAAGPVGAYASVKRLLGESQPGFQSQLARESREIAFRGSTAEGCEGINAFLEKRKPHF